MEKKTYFWSIEVGWYKELEVKEFCHFDYIDLQLFNGLFQNNYFKKYMSQKAKLLYTCLKCLFLWPRWLSLGRSVCLIIIEK